MQAARSNAAAEHAQATVAKLTRENATLRANVRASMAKAAETRLRQQAGAAARSSEAAGASVAASQKELTALRAHCQQLERESEKLKEAQTQLQEALARQVGQGERAAAAARQQVRRLQADARAQQLAFHLAAVAELRQSDDRTAHALCGAEGRSTTVVAAPEGVRGRAAP